MTLIIYLIELRIFVYFFCVGVLGKIGIEPQVVRIGKYKSAGDQLTRTTMSEENCEMLTALLNNIYGDWLDTVSSAKGNWHLRLFSILKYLQN